MDVLGNEFVKSDGTDDASGWTTVDGSAVKDKVIGIYFSAHWCPPCRGFTPKLVEFYNNMKASHPGEFEIIFASSDQDDAQFNEYFGKEMPWLALPFKDRDLKNNLSKKFKVQGIPMFVILDKDGSVITTDGRSKVQGDMQGESFPWRPKPLSELLAGGFVNNNGETQPASCIEGKTLGLYFSAHWCPPCRGFTPTLAEMYNKLKAAGKPFEIIFISSDRDKAGFDEYMQEMPWLALPFDKRAEKEEIAGMFNVSGIPQLTICDDTASRNSINENARNAVMADPEGAKFPWIPPPLKILPDGTDAINEETCFIALLEQCDDDDQEDFLKILDSVAAEYKAKGDDMVFMATKGGDPVSPQIRKLTKIKPKPTPQLLILDIPDSGGYHEPVGKITTITEENVKAFISDYKNKKTERKQLSQ